METMARRKITYRTVGTGGPKVVLVPGGPAAALVAELARSHTVHLLDRRGGGLAAEVDDLVTVLDETGAGNVAGLGSGAVVALHAALGPDRIERLALFEPPLRYAGHDPVADVKAGRLRRLVRLTVRRPGLELERDVLVVDEAAGSFERYRAVTAETLLLGSARASAYGKRVLNGLDVVVPRARQVTLRGAATPRAVAAELRKFFR